MPQISQRPRRQDRRHRDPQPLDPGQRHRTGQVRLDAEPAAADRYAEVKRKYEGTQFRVEPTINTYYFWMNTTEGAVRRPRRCARRSTTRSTRRRWNGSTPAQLAGTQQILPPGMPGLRRSSSSTRTTWPRRSELIAASRTRRDRDITVWTDNESPNNEAGAYYQDVLKKLGFDATAEGRSTPTTTSR